jgi:hypothetical protein
VDQKFANANAQGKPRLGVSFPDGTSNTILFAEKYAAASISAAANNGVAYQGGCHWAYFQADCRNPYIAFYETPTDPKAMAPGHFQVQPNPASCNPCLPATGHAALNVCMGDGSVRALSAGMAPVLWWSLVTPAGGRNGRQLNRPAFPLVHCRAPRIITADDRPSPSFQADIVHGCDETLFTCDR